MPRGKHKNRCIDCNRLHADKDLYYVHRCKICHRRYNAEKYKILKLFDKGDKNYGRQGKRKVT